MRFRAYEIFWDTDGESVPQLPSESVVDADSPDDIADALSDRFGFCVHGLKYEEIAASPASL